MCACMHALNFKLKCRITLHILPPGFKTIHLAAELAGCLVSLSRSDREPKMQAFETSCSGRSVTFSQPHTLAPCCRLKSLRHSILSLPALVSSASCPLIHRRASGACAATSTAKATSKQSKGFGSSSQKSSSSKSKDGKNGSSNTSSKPALDGNSKCACGSELLYKVRVQHQQLLQGSWSLPVNTVILGGSSVYGAGSWTGLTWHNMGTFAGMLSGCAPRSVGPNSSGPCSSSPRRTDARERQLPRQQHAP